MEGFPFAPSPIGDSAAKAMPVEAAMMPKAAVAANREAVVFFMISPETDVMRDECTTLTGTGSVRSGIHPYSTTLPDHQEEFS
jgi:hypothetical protein